MRETTAYLLAQRYLPVLSWGKQYNWRQQLLRDIVSGITVGFMTVPQALSYAAVAGLPAERGLYASLVAMVMYAVLGTSPHLVCGPTAVMAIMVRTSIPEEWQDVELHPADALVPAGSANGTYAARGLAAAGPATDVDPHVFQIGQSAYVDAASILTFFAGMLQLLIGAGGAGFVFQLISAPVVAGFTSAAALLIVSTQLTTALGLQKCTTDTDSRCSFFENIAHVLGSLPSSKAPVVGGTLACLAVLFVFKYGIRPRLQGPWKPLGNMGPIVILAIFTPIYYVYEHSMRAAGLASVGHVPKGLPAPEAPFRAPPSWADASEGQDFLSADAVLSLVPGALGMAAVGFLEANAISRVVARRTGTPPPGAPAELRALGLTNCATACFRGFAVTGSFSRTAVNVDAGASSGVSGAVAAIVVALVCLFLTPALAFLPMVCLAAIILIAVVNLLEVKEAVAFFRTSAREFSVFCIVFLSVLAVGVEAGLAIGIMASWALTLSSQQWEHTPGVVLMRATADGAWQDTFSCNASSAQIAAADKVLILAVQGDISFAGADALADAVQEGVGVFKPTVVVLDVTASSRGDTSGVLALQGLAATLESEGGVELILGGVSTSLAQQIQRMLTQHLPTGPSDTQWARLARDRCSTAAVHPQIVQHGVLGFANVRSALAVARAPAAVAKPGTSEVDGGTATASECHSSVPRDKLTLRHWERCRARWLAAARGDQGSLQTSGGSAANASPLSAPSPRVTGRFAAAAEGGGVHGHDVLLEQPAPPAGCPQVFQRFMRQAKGVLLEWGCVALSGEGPASKALLGEGPRQRQPTTLSAFTPTDGPDDCLVHLGPAPEYWLGQSSLRV